jgi:NAD(P)-dependent dehydrogenase (short-subunit alcohol dehydrogenase family)
LDAGDQVLATARTPAQLYDLAERYADRVLVVALDVTDAAAVASAFEAAVGRFGRVDVVVNNAGYANVAPVETASEEDFRRQFETNFWGVYNVSKAALPVLKAQGTGTIVQFSSVGYCWAVSPEGSSINEAVAMLTSDDAGRSALLRVCFGVR